MLEFYERKARQQETLAKWHEECEEFEAASCCDAEAINYREMARLQKDMT
jgi:hypothetical protein